MYDTSWDGQDYQQSGVIALHAGWNPWYQKDLPITLPQSTNYVVGYPKLTWLLQDSVYTLTGNLQMATITNVVAAIAAGGLVYGALRRLKLGNKWAIGITLLAVLQIHFLQQLPTFMQDGLSYELSLAAIAALLIFMLDNRQWLLLGAFLSAWIWLAGSKFSNLFVCALLALACLAYLYKIKAYRRVELRWLLAVGVLGILSLGVPYSTNVIRFGSPVYPQNQAGASQKLLDDNLPTNIKHDNRLALLFYGIFSHIEPSDAGAPSSNGNVARLKVPFTFAPYEFEQLNNFQGRLGSGGLLFSGIVCLSAIGYGMAAFTKKNASGRRFFVGVSVLVGLIILAALVIPVANKLRYSPLVTLIPLLVTVLCVQVTRGRQHLKISALVIVLLVAANTGIAATSFAMARNHEAAVINSQLAAMRSTHQVYQVQASNLYSSYTRLTQARVPFVVAKQLTCPHPSTLEYTNWTTGFCSLHK